jgi:WD40 repeat protein
MRHFDAITAIALNPAGTLVATGAAWKDKTARLWDAHTGRPVGSPMPHGADVFSLALRPEGRSPGHGFRRQYGAVVERPHRGTGGWADEARRSCSYRYFDRRGRFLATGSLDDTARLWKADTGEPIGEPMQHGGPVWAVAFDPKGKLLATGSLTMPLGSGLRCRPAHFSNGDVLSWELKVSRGLCRHFCIP